MEAFKTIISAWAWGFIVLFFFTTCGIFSRDYVPDGIALDWFIFMCGAVSGTGWLIYRRRTRHDWESIARISGQLAKALYEEMQREYSFQQEANSPAMRAYEQARDEARNDS